MIRLGIAGESHGDVQILSSLVDRLIEEGVDWIERGVVEGRSLMDANRQWVGVGEHAWVDVHKHKELRRRYGIRAFGSFSGDSAAADALMYRNIFHFFLHPSNEGIPEALVIGRDLDRDDARREGLSQAIRERSWPFRVIAGLAAPEIEAWLLAAWAPETAADEAALKEVRGRVGFDPTRSGERLTSKKDDEPKDAKRALRELCAKGRAAEERWEDAPIDRLTGNGEGCGLKDFVDAVRRDLLPLFTGRPPTP